MKSKIEEKKHICGYTIASSIPLCWLKSDRNMFQQLQQKKHKKMTTYYEVVHDHWKKAVARKKESYSTCWKQLRLIAFFFVSNNKSH